MTIPMVLLALAAGVAFGFAAAKDWYPLPVGVFAAFALLGAAGAAAVEPCSLGGNTGDVCNLFTALFSLSGAPYGALALAIAAGAAFVTNYLVEKSKP